MSDSWPPYEHVNVQLGLESWLRRSGRNHRLVGVTGFQHRVFSLADLAQDESAGHGPGLGLGSVAMANQPSGPSGQTYPVCNVPCTWSRIRTARSVSCYAAATAAVRSKPYRWRSSPLTRTGRRPALAAEEDVDGPDAVTVASTHLATALDRLLDEQNTMTRILLAAPGDGPALSPGMAGPTPAALPDG